MFKILENIFKNKNQKIKNIEDKISKFYLSNIGVDINNPNELKKYKIKFKNREKELEAKNFKDDSDTILIKYIPSENGILLINNIELNKDYTVMLDVIGYIEKKNMNITIYANNLEAILG